MRLAAYQFAVCGDIDHNLEIIKKAKQDLCVRSSFTVQSKLEARSKENYGRR